MLNGRQTAALGPRYGEFKSLYGHTSGVALGVAIAYGIDVDAFERPFGESQINGELALKVWTRHSGLRMLWCYVACDGGGLACFPLFKTADAPIASAMQAPIGARVNAVLSADERGRTLCREFSMN